MRWEVEVQGDGVEVVVVDSSLIYHDHSHTSLHQRGVMGSNSGYLATKGMKLLFF